MKKLIKKSIVAAICLASAGLAQHAVSGHLNTVLEAELDGRSEVSNDANNRRMVGDPNGRGEIYVFGIDGDPATLCYVLQVSKVSLESPAAHIHIGQPGENGPVVAFLAGPAGGDAADCLSEGEPGKFNLDVLGGDDEGIVQDILANPQDYYVNMHNADYPGGAVRGQLSNVQD